MRIAAVVKHEFALDNGAAFNPSVSIGIREDGKRQQSFLGMLMGGRLGLVDPHGFEVTTEGEVLLTGTDQVQEWGMSGELSYDAGSNRLGIQLRVKPDWGRSMRVADSTLWNSGILNGSFDSDLYTNGFRMDTEIGYGISIWDGVGLLKPYYGILMAEVAADEMNLGSTLSFGADYDFAVEGSRNISTEGSFESGVTLRGEIKW